MAACPGPGVIEGRFSRKPDEDKKEGLLAQLLLFAFEVRGIFSWGGCGDIGRVDMSTGEGEVSGQQVSVVVWAGE